jgi:hypothetical protein
MSLMTLSAVLLLGAGPAPPRDAARLSRLVDEIRAADYRGQRARLRDLAAALDAVKAKGLAPYRDYWRGFALWRRALNGFNETPLPDDLRSDLSACVRSFRAALARRPGWVEAQAGMVGCAASLLYLARDDEEQKRPILAEFVPLAREIAETGKDNPRVLWLLGGFQAWSPPPYGGHPDRAAATYRRALEAARREGRQSPAPPAWIPTWGGPENLMSLAALHAQGTVRNPELARAYAEGALAAVPDWHYVANVLLPQIEAAAAPAAATK